MTDIVDRLRREVVWESDVGDVLNAAADEIERLRNGVACPHVRGTVTQYCSLNFTLSAAEREAIEVAAAAYADDCLGGRFAAILRRLLERLPT